MKNTISYRLVVAGIDVEVRNQKAMETLFATLGGKVLSVSDKAIEMEFPTTSEKAEFMAAAKANGAIFDSSK